MANGRLYYRMFIQGTISGLAGVHWGLVSASLLFGCSHVRLTLPGRRSIIDATAYSVGVQGSLGLLLGLSWMHTLSVWPGAVMHALFNALVLAGREAILRAVGRASQYKPGWSEVN